MTIFQRLIAVGRRPLAAFITVSLLAGAPGLADDSRRGDGFEAERYYHFIKSTYRELNRDDAAALESMIRAAALGEGSWRLKMEAARLYSRTGDNGAALKYAREAMALNPAAPSARLLVAWLAGLEGDQETAEREYLKVLELDRDNIEAMYWLGALYFEDRRHQEAEKIFKRLVEADPGAASFYRLGHLYRGLDRKSEAIRALQSALKKDADFPDALEDLAALYEETGQIKAAEKTWRRLVEIRPDAVMPKNGLARLLLKAGRRQEAEKIVAEMLQEERRFRASGLLAADDDEARAGRGGGDAIRTRIRLGLIYMSLELYREAAGEFEAVLKARPGHDRARYLLASALLERAEPGAPSPGADRAFKLLEAVESDSPLYTDARLLMASAIRGRDERDTLEKSLALVEAAGRARPDSYRLRLARAMVTERLGETEKARDILLKASSDFPQEAEIRFRLGVMEDQLGHKRAAIEAMRQAIGLDPRHADALNYLAYTWAERRENLAEALTMAEKADALKPDQGYILDTVAWIHYQMGRPLKALPILKRAAPLSSRDPVVLEHLGDVLRALDRNQEALEAYRQALEGAFADKEALNEKIRKIVP